MRKIAILSLILISLLVVGCQDQESTAPATPETTAPAELPAEEPAEAPATEPAPTADPGEEPTAKPAEIAGDPVVPTVEVLEECFADPPADSDLDLDVDCGYVIVPEFHNSDSTSSLKLGFTRANSGAGTAVSPLFIYVGGPGQANASENIYLLLQPNLLGGILEERDIVFVEQRGTKHTDTFLDCPAIYQTSWQAYEQGLDKAAADELTQSILEDCIKDFQDQGVNFDAYNSVENAADVNAMREALGYDQIIYYGGSYGSQLGQHVMRDFPEILEAAVLDGAAALSRRDWTEDRALDAQWSLENLTSLCAANEKCKENYDIPLLLDASLALFEDGPIPYSYTDPNDSSLVIENYFSKEDFVQYIHGQQGSKYGVSSIPYILNLLDSGGTDAIAELLGETAAQKLIASQNAEEGAMAVLQHMAMVCSDDPVHSEDNLNLKGVTEYAKTYGLSEFELYSSLCEIIDVAELPDSTDVDVDSDVPTLLLTGGLDVETPAYHSEEVADFLPSATMFLFPSGTHVQVTNINLCAVDVMTQFVHDPAAELDASCIEEVPPLVFVLPDGTITADEEASSASTNESTSAGETDALPQELVTQLDTFLLSQVYSEGGNPTAAAPGLILLVDTPDGQYLKAAGVADIEVGTSMQVDDILVICSNTKSMTMVLLMQLVEEGLISLDDPLSQYLPDQAAIVPNGDQITIRQLAQHTAGIHDYEEEIITNQISDPAAVEAGYTPAEIVQIAMDAGEPYFAPGEEGQWHYSNTGYILLGMIIETVTGDSLGDLLQSRIFEPLGLESAVLIEGVPQAGEIMTNGYYWTEEGERLDTTNWNGSQGWAAGAVAMTAEDLAAYGQVLAAGEFFQDPDTLGEMLMFNPSAMSSGFPYGMGLIDFAGDGTIWGHEGATPGFQSLWYTDPEEEIVVVGLTNSGNYAAWAFLNVLNILNGAGAQPFGSATLLPVGEFVPTTWGWTQFVTPSETMDIDEMAGLQVDLAKDKSVTAYSNDCGLAFGAFTTDVLGQINFDIDPASLTCEADSQAAQFVQHLNDATTWHIANGQFIVELPSDAGRMIFEYLPPQ